MFHLSSSPLVGVLLSGLALLGCTGEAEWVLTNQPQSELPAAKSEERGRPEGAMSSFQGLSSGLPAGKAPEAIAHLDGTVYLVVDGQLFSLGSGANAWSVVGLALGPTEKVTSVTRIDLALFVTTTEGLVRLDWGDAAAVRLPAAPKGGWALLRKGGELLLATPMGCLPPATGVPASPNARARRCSPSR